MSPPFRVSLAALMIASIMIVVGLGLTNSARAADSGQVPAPDVNERHNFNKYEEYNGTQGKRLDNENWRIEIRHGNVITLIGATNYTDTDLGQSNVAYSQNINFKTNDKLWIAMFMVDRIILKIGGQEEIALLKTCSGFTMTRTAVTYDGNIPVLECNITFENIHVYDGVPDSTFDMSLIHHFRGDWNQTSIKVEARFDFTNTKFYNNGTEIAAGEHFTAELRYIMELTDPDSRVGDNAVMPSGVSDTSLEYDLTLDNGSPYTLSKLEMRDSFMIYNASGAHSATGYSTMQMANRSVAGLEMYNPKSAVVTHGFPNLVYGDTQSMKSDPEITIFHDRVTGGVLTQPYYLLLPILIAIALVVAVLVIRRKRKGRQDDAEKPQKKA